MKCKNYLINIDMDIYGFFEVGSMHLCGMWKTSPGTAFVALNLKQKQNRIRVKTPNEVEFRVMTVRVHFHAY